MKKKLIAILVLALMAQPAQALIIYATGRSMWPTFPAKCLLRVKFIAYEDLKAGMVVAYRPAFGKGFTAHRLVFKDRRGRWFTKGDNNPHIDLWPVTPRNYQGVCEYFADVE